MAVHARPMRQTRDSDTLQLAALSVAISAVALWAWWVGAGYTLSAISALWPDSLLPLGYLMWGIPVLASIIEVFGLKHMRSSRLSTVVTVMMFVVSGIDLASTAYGLNLAIAGKFFPLLQGFTVPAAGPWPVALSLLIGAGFTFLPEAGLMWAIATLRKIWG